MTDTTALPQIISERELAQHLGLNPRTLARMRDERRGPPHIRIGRKIAYRSADVTAWLARQVVGASQ